MSAIEKFYEFTTESKFQDILSDIRKGLLDGLSLIERDKKFIISDGTSEVSITDDSYNRSNPQTLLSDNPTAIHETLYILKAEGDSSPQLIIDTLENYYGSFISYLGG